MNEETKDRLQKTIEYIRESIDLAVQAGEAQYPVMSSTLVKTGTVHNRKVLDIMENMGLIKSITVEVPSVLKPGATVPEKGYYTERLVPELVKSKQADKSKLH